MILFISSFIFTIILCVLTTYEDIDLYVDENGNFYMGAE